MYTAEVEIEGIVPMKQNKVSESYGQSEELSPVKTEESVEKEWKSRAYQNEAGFYIPVQQLQATILAGLSAPKPLVSNKVKIFKKTAKACIFVNGDAQMTNGKLPLTYTKDINFVPTPTGLATLIRPMFKEGWKAKFTVACVEDWLTPKTLEEGIKRAGKCHGIGSHRPLFGRFIVNSFKILT